MPAEASALPRVGSFGAVREGAGEWGVANDDGDLSPLSPSSGAQPFSAAFAQRSVEETDKFVLQALVKGGDPPGPQLGIATVPGELDALSFAMGALWELAAESGVNQVRARAHRAQQRDAAHSPKCAPSARLLPPGRYPRGGRHPAAGLHAAE